jgi:hypothetical protein
MSKLRGSDERYRPRLPRVWVGNLRRPDLPALFPVFGVVAFEAVAAVDLDYSDWLGVGLLVVFERRFKVDMAENCPAVVEVVGAVGIVDKYCVFANLLIGIGPKHVFVSSVMQEQGIGCRFSRQVKGQLRWQAIVD